MLESLGVTLFCVGFFVCMASYAILTVTGSSCSAYRKALEKELSYTSVDAMEKRLDIYLDTLLIVMLGLLFGCVAVIAGIIMVPALFNCLGVLLIGLYGTIFVYIYCRKKMQTPILACYE